MQNKPNKITINNFNPFLLLKEFEQLVLDGYVLSKNGFHQYGALFEIVVEKQDGNNSRPDPALEDNIVVSESVDSQPAQKKAGRPKKVV